MRWFPPGRSDGVHMITPEIHRYDIRMVERLRNPALAGGALLDVGIYPLTFIRMIAFKMPPPIRRVETNQGWVNTVTFVFEDGCMATMHSSMLWSTTGGNRVWRQGIFDCMEYQ